MSNIDKDSKSKVAKPTDRKFLLGLLDGYLPHNKSMLVGLAVSSILRRGK